MAQAPDMTVSDPNPNAAAYAARAAVDYSVGMHQADQAKTTALTRLAHQNEYETIPQLKSSIAGAGNWYGTAREKAFGNLARHTTEASDDITLSWQKQRTDLDRQQAWASMGILI